MDVDDDLDHDYQFSHVEDWTKVPIQPGSDVFHSASAFASAMAVLCRGSAQVNDNDVYQHDSLLHHGVNTFLYFNEQGHSAVNTARYVKKINVYEKQNKKGFYIFQINDGR